MSIKYIFKKIAGLSGSATTSNSNSDVATAINKVENSNAPAHDTDSSGSKGEDAASETSHPADTEAKAQNGSQIPTPEAVFTAKAKDTCIHNVIVLDASGSMSDRYDGVLSGFNELLSGIKSSQEEEPSVRQTISLVIFKGVLIEPVYVMADPSGIAPLDRRSYVLGSTTPLNDAIGYTIGRTEEEISRMVRENDGRHDAVITIITDGYENSSQHFTGQQIVSMIGRCKEMGWTISYMGTEVDVLREASRMGIENYHSFSSDEAGMEEAFMLERKARKLHSKEAANLCCESEEEYQAWRKRRAAKHYSEENLI